jgi:hypothetical protein
MRGYLPEDQDYKKRRNIRIPKEKKTWEIYVDFRLD